jgi:DNA-binding MarR family transcriptional regulator
MQQLHPATIATASPARCARQLMDVIPTVMRHIITQMRKQRVAGMSVPQFRALVLLDRHGNPHLTDLAETLGLSVPSASRMIQGLVLKGFVVREPGSSDRRQITLTLSDRGREVMKNAQRKTEAQLAEVLANLSADQRGEVSHATDLLREAFLGNGDSIR